MYRINRICWNTSIPITTTITFDSAIGLIKDSIGDLVKKKITKNHLVFKEDSEERCVVYLRRNLYLDNGKVNPFAVGFEVIKEEL